jgi:hypothetical protein
MRKNAVIFLAFAVLSASLLPVGCGGESNQSQASDPQAMEFLLESSQAMSELFSYRMSGSMIMDSTDDAMAEAGFPMSIEFESDIIMEDGEFSQHMVTSTKAEAIGEYETESFVIGNQFYQYDPTQGWLRMDTSKYMAQNLNTGFVDAQRIELMAGIAQDARIFEEDDQMIGVSFHMDENYMKAVIDSAQEYMQELGQSLSEEWLQSVQVMIAGSQADVSMWIWRDSKLVDHMEMLYLFGGTTMQNIELDMRINMYDYNQEIEIVLPEEAKQAKEYTPSM